MQMEELENPANSENLEASDDACNGESLDPPPHHHGCFPDDVDSNCSTPYVSAPSSPGRGAPSGYFFSAPASPMHFVLSSSSYTCAAVADGALNAAGEGLVSGSFEFEFSARFSGAGGAGAAAAGSMISADELFLNGQIRPMNLSSHLLRPQVLTPLMDLEDEDEEAGDDREEPAVRGRDLKMRNRSLRRRARSMSPLRTSPFQWHDEEVEEESSGQRSGAGKGGDADPEGDPDVNPTAAATPSVSASSSRSSSTSSSRNSKRWVFLKDLLYRSKSEGRGNAKDKFWNVISFSPSKEKTSFFFRDRFKESTKTTTASPSSSSSAAPAASPTTSEPQKPKQRSTQPSGASSATTSTSKKPSSTSSKPTNGVGKRRVPSQSPHERHYTANRAQAEEMRKKTFLPYRQGLLGCLWFSSRSYGAVNGFARTLNPVSSR